MKHLFIIGVITVLLAGLSTAGEVNQPAEKVQSAETKSLSSDNIITAFTFLLAALTVMATLFGVFIGYMGYKSSREYEREVGRAEAAARRAEASSEKAHRLLSEIHEKRAEADAATIGIKEKIEEIMRDVSSQTISEKTQPSEMKDKAKELIDTIERKIESGDPLGTEALIEAGILFLGDNVHWWSLWAATLGKQGKWKDALDKATIAITKSPNDGSLYGLRSLIKAAHVLISEKEGDKAEAVRDMEKAIELGYEPKKSIKQVFAQLLDNSEYNKLFRTAREDNELGKE